VETSQYPHSPFGSPVCQLRRPEMCLMYR